MVDHLQHAPPLDAVVKGSLSDARELLRVELELVKEEGRAELRRTLRSMVWLAIGWVALTVSVALFCVFVLTLLGDREAVVGAAIFACAFALAGVIALALGRRRLRRTSGSSSAPSSPMERQRWQSPRAKP